MQAAADSTDIKLKKQMDKLARGRKKWRQLNSYYYRDMSRFFKFHIPNNSSILEIGSGTGELLSELSPRRGLGVDISREMIGLARENFRTLEFMEMRAEELSLDENFDFVIITDTVGYFSDVQTVFHRLKKTMSADSRLILTYHNFFWMPLLKLAEILHLKMPQKPLNWLNRDDLINLLELEGYEVIKTGRRFLFPIFIPILSGLINRFLAQLPIINRLCLTTYLIARLPQASKEMSVSIIIPARNEKGNIEQAVKRLPVIGSRTEIIFIEGGSTDGTFEEIERVAGLYPEKNISFGRQEGKGKGDAVRKGFSMATGDILMILDADLTVAPEDLPKFYSALRADRGEFINGCRLVYPLEKDSMMTLNIFGNKFFSLMFSWLLGQRLKDTLCGTKVISRKNYERLAANRAYFGEFDPFGDFDLIFGAAKLDLKIAEIPIQYHARQYGETNISRFKHGWLLLKMVAFAMNKIKFI